MALVKALAVGFIAMVIIAFNSSSGSLSLIGGVVVAVIAYIYFKGTANVARAAGSATAQVEGVARGAIDAFKEGRNPRQ